MSNSRDLFKTKMENAAMNSDAADLFLTYYDTLKAGNTGVIHERDIKSVSYGSLPKLSELPAASNADVLLKKSVVIKLNGGMGTSMGLTGPKSFLPVRQSKRFIDIVIDQIESLQTTTGEDVPLLLMNSAVTDELTTELMNTKEQIAVDGVPFSFVHNSHPKVLVDSFAPASLPNNEGGEWNPAGHGDIYTALLTTGILDQLLDKGYEYAFISNIDNLGATLDTKLLAHFAEQKLPFMMEVCRRREMDKKGGHLAKDHNDNFILRERAQADENEIEQFESIDNYAYFNSNSIWINLPQLKQIAEANGKVELPLIANKKHLIPTDSSTPEVYQIETAMGSAIALFEGASAIEIDQKRFRPVKKNNDLLLLWSDRFELNSKGELVEADNVTASINVDLDSVYYATYPDLEKRVGSNVPSLKKCDSLSVIGDVSFGENVVIEGDVIINNSGDVELHISNRTIKNETVTN